MSSRPSLRIHLALLGAIAVGLAVSGGVLGTLARVPEPSHAAAVIPTGRAVVPRTASLTTVRITAPTASVALPVGAELVLDIPVTGSSPWGLPSDSDPAVLRPQSVDTGALALHAVYLGERSGGATLELDQGAGCVSTGAAGVCAAQAFRITVTVTGG